MSDQHGYTNCDICYRHIGGEGFCCDCDTPVFRIVRFYRDYPWRKRTVKRGVTLREARAHCSNPETSSSTATSGQARARTRKFGPWFDGYTDI